MERAFIRKGHGYENPSPGSGYEPCKAFEGFTVIANPLGGPYSAADRERRVFRGEKPGQGCDYSSHSIQLAIMTSEADRKSPSLYILMQNGSGREVLMLPGFYGAGLVDNQAALLAMPERQLYAMLYTIWQVASNARHEAADAMATKWRDAYLDGRIRKSRPRGGYYRCFVESPFERDLRTGKANPSRIAIDVATGEARAAQ